MRSSSHLAQHLHPWHRRLVADYDRLAAQRERRGDAAPIAVMQVEKRLATFDAIPEFHARNQSYRVIDRLADASTPRAEEIARAADGLGPQARQEAGARCECCSRPATDGSSA